MRTIQKFPLELKAEQNIYGPIDRIIYVGPDCDGKPCLYAEVDTGDVPYGMHVYMVRAGEPILPSPHTLQYKGTILAHAAWHVYM